MCIHRVTSGCSVVDSWSIQPLKEQQVYSTLEPSVTAPSGNCTDAEAVEPKFVKVSKEINTVHCILQCSVYYSVLFTNEYTETIQKFGVGLLFLMSIMLFKAARLSKYFFRIPGE